jgi:hypothetical protein
LISHKTSFRPFGYEGKRITAVGASASRSHRHAAVRSRRLSLP